MMRTDNSTPMGKWADGQPGGRSARLVNEPAAPKEKPLSWFGLLIAFPCILLYEMGKELGGIAVMLAIPILILDGCFYLFSLIIS